MAKFRNSLPISMLVTLCLLGGVKAQEKEWVGNVVDIDGPRLFTDRVKSGSWFQAYSGMKTYLFESFKTDSKTQAVFEFLLGGRAGISPNSSISIVSPTDISKPKVLKIDQGSFWAKFDKQKKPIQIQTSGGVIGIEGTELLVHVDSDGVTEVLLFEGQISVEDDKGGKKTLFAGDYAEFGGGGSFCVLSYPSSSLRVLITERFPTFSSFVAAQRVTSIPTDSSATLLRGANPTRPGLLSVLEQARLSPEPSRTALSPVNQSTQNQSPTFGWSATPGASSYAIFFSDQESFSNLLFTSRVEGTSFVIPSGAPGLSPGKVYWTVVPLDEDGHPLTQASLGSFDSAGWNSSGYPLSDLEK